MNLMRLDPFSEGDDFFTRLAPTFFRRWPRLTLPAGAETKVEWTPSADISETEKEFVIRAQLPAVRKEDIKVTVDRDSITVHGERKHQSEDKTEKFHRVETFYGSFSRTFAVPDNVDAEKIRCESKDGVLSVHLPKKTAATPKSKQIPVG